MEHGKESGHGHGHGGCGCGGQGGGGGCLSEKKVRKMSIMMASHHVAEDASLDELLKVANRLADFILEGKL